MSYIEWSLIAALLVLYVGSRVMMAYLSRPLRYEHTRHGAVMSGEDPTNVAREDVGTLIENVAEAVRRSKELHRLVGTNFAIKIEGKKLPIDGQKIVVMVPHGKSMIGYGIRQFHPQICRLMDDSERRNVEVRDSEIIIDPDTRIIPGDVVVLRFDKEDRGDVDSASVDIAVDPNDVEDLSHLGDNPQSILRSLKKSGLKLRLLEKVEQGPDGDRLITSKFGLEQKISHDHPIENLVGKVICEFNIAAFEPN